MLRLPPFRYLAPRSLAEAAAMLVEHGPQAALVAGGTDLYPNMKRRQQEPAVVIGLRGVPELRGVGEQEDGWVRLGATTTLAQAAAHPLLRQRYPAYTAAVASVSTPHLRRMGTVGGNVCLDTRCNYYDQGFHWRRSIDFCMKKDGAICWVAPSSPRCWAVSSSDTAPVLLVLGARARLVSAAGERLLAAADLFRDDGIAYLTKRPDEVLADLLLPPLPASAGWRSTYRKLRRRGSFDFPILGVAAAVRLEGCLAADVRLALGAVGSAPVNVSAHARPLLGSRPTLEAVDAVASAAHRAARPLDNTDLNYAWRKKMARIEIRRALAEVLGLAEDVRRS